MKELFLTVFTPTYNREKHIRKLYQSLCKQTNHHFEWLLIDDGSIDDTWALLKQIESDCTLFTVRSFRQNNSGKHVAINRALDLARGQYFFIVDSDDRLECDAIEKIYSWIQSIENSHNIGKFAGVAGLKMSGEKIVGGKGKRKGIQYIDATNLERGKYNLGGDKAEVYKTDILRHYKFPVFEGEKFLSEEVVWDKIAIDGYKIRWFLQPIYLCEYQDEGLTKTLGVQLLNNFKGFTYQTRQAIRYKPLRGKIHAIYEYVKISKEKGNNLIQSSDLLEVIWPMVLLCYIWGAIYMQIRKVKFVKVLK